MTKYTKSTYKFLHQFGNNVSFAKGEIDKLIQFYSNVENKEKLNELLLIKQELQ